MKKKIKLVISIICIFLLGYLLYKNSYKYKLTHLYENPIEINQKYKDFTYNEYDNYVTVLTYDGQDKEVVIPEFINNKPVYAIDDSAFYGNTNLIKVTIPSRVVRIGHQAFKGCEHLKEVNMPDNIVDLGEWSFKVCTSLKKINVKKGSKTDKTLKKSSFKKYINYK